MALMLLTTTLPLSSVSVKPALETDLEPYSKLKRFELEFDFGLGFGLGKMNFMNFNSRARSNVVVMVSRV